MSTKICKQCGGDPKPLSDFYPHPATKDKRMNICKACHIAGAKETNKKREDGNYKPRKNGKGRKKTRQRQEYAELVIRVMRVLGSKLPEGV